MIGSRRAAVTASVIGALLIAGVPSFAFGEGDSAHTAKDNAVTAQKAKDSDNQKAADDSNKADKNKADKNKADKNKADNNKADNNKKDAGNQKAAPEKKDNARKADDQKKAADPKRSSDDNKKNDNRKSDDNKKDDNNKADKNKNDNRGDDAKKSADNKRDEERKNSTDPRHKDDWKNSKHDDKWNKDWDHNRDRDHRHHDWDTHRRYYRYGYYGPGWYDDCGYYSPGYDGYNDDYYYYGPDACGYEYGGYRSHFLVDMSWDQEVPRPGPDGAVGTANIDIDVPAGRLCFRLAYDGIDQAVGAQIHPGRLGEGGPSIALLHVGQNGDDGCVGVDPQILSEIQNNPTGYYLEIDDQNGPAMRGQLAEPDYRNRY